MREKKKKSIKSSFAFDINGNEITIHAALSGRRGYYCPSEECKRPMEAVKPLQQKPRPYFRHVATDVQTNQKPCTYSDETYRHKIAKEILVRIKSIKVPKVHKFPPKGFDGPTKQVSPLKTIVAFDVQVERDFYEDENQNLHWGRFEGSEKKSIVRPDVIFFNAGGLPILFIELVATHKPDFIKLEKIKRLGIDTVTVKIPIESSQAIEDCFSNTYNTKWFFNNEQERADYFQLPGSPAERISDVDKVQRRLFEETTICRKNRVRNLIRAFNACLLAEQYSGIESGIRTKISGLDDEQSKRHRIEREFDAEAFDFFSEPRATIRMRQEKLERVRKYLKEKEAVIEDDAYNEFIGRRGKIGREEGRLNSLRFRIKERYEGKKRELEEEEERFTRIVGIQDENPEGEIGYINTNDERIRNEIQELDEGIIRIEGEIRTVQKEMDSIPESFERKRAGIIQKYRSEGKRMEAKYQELERREHIFIEQLKGEETEFEGAIGSARDGIIKRFEGEKSGIIESIKRRDISEDSSLSREIKDVVSTGEQLLHYQSEIKTFDRYTEALRFLNSEAFKDWVKSRRVP